MPDIAEKIAECHSWRKIDTHALGLVLRTHQNECGRDDPRTWTIADVETVTEALLNGVTLTPETAATLADTWLTWCDFLVETGQLAPPKTSPRDLREAVRASGEELHGFVGVGSLPRAVVSAMSRSGVDLDDDDSIAAWLKHMRQNPAQLAELVELDSRATSRRHAIKRMARENTSSLPPVRLAPLSELASDVRACAPLTTAREIAVWIGPGRSLADEHEGLREEDAAEAVAELGVSRAELPRWFDIAVEAGFIRLTYTQALPGPALGQWPGGDDQTVLGIWVDGFDAGTIIPQSRFLASLALTHLFTCGVRRLLRKELAEAAGEVLDFTTEDLVAAVDRLAEYGVVELVGDEVELTPLGDYAMIERLRRTGEVVDVLPTVADLTAAELLSTLAMARPTDAEPLTADWLAIRDTMTGARDILAAAEAPAAYLARGMATRVVKDLGPEVVPVWREWIEHSTLGGWAREALAEFGEELPAATSGDRLREIWMLLDAWAILVDQGYPDQAARSVAALVEHTDQIFDLIWRLGHPGVARVLDAVGSLCPDKKVAKAARRAAFKLNSAH